MHSWTKKELHTILEYQITPACKTTERTIVGLEYENEINEFLLSDDNIARLMAHLSEDYWG